MTVKPWVVLLVIAVFGTLLAGIFWAGTQERAQQGPSLLRADQQGDLYVVFHENILRLSPEGRFKNTYRLRDLGVGEMIGGLDFFRDGDVLLRSGDSLPGLFDQILIHLRMRQPEASSNNPGDRLVRCNLDNLTCAPLAGFDLRFNRTFRIAIDDADNIFIADTAREALYWLDASGRKIAEARTGFRLPNQLTRDGDRIVVTNTNHHELTFVPLTKTGFEAASQWQHLKVNTPEARETRETWPMDLLKIGSEWLVLSQGSNMAFGDVFRFSEDGSFRLRFNLPAEVDPLAIARFGNDVIVADYAGLRLLRYSDTGESRGELVVPEITDYADGVRAARDRFALYQTLLWLLFAVVLVTGFAVAIFGEIRVRRERREIEAARKSHVKSAPMQSSPRPSVDDVDIHWISPGKTGQRLLKTMSLLLVAGIVLMSIPLMNASSNQFSKSAYLALLAVLLTFVVVLIIGFGIGRRILATIRIGVVREWLILRDWRNRIAIGRGDEILLMPNAIAIGGVALQRGQKKHALLFDQDEWNRWVEPRLIYARKFTHLDILMWTWKYQKVHLLAAVVALLIMLVWTLAH